MSETTFPRRSRIDAKDACLERLTQLNILPAPIIYPVPCDPGKGGVEVAIQTNVFGLKFLKDTKIFQYVAHIKMDLNTEKEIIFTKKAKNDFIVADRHEKCCAIFSYAVKKHDEFFRNNENCLVYDGQSIIFSSIDLFKDYSEIETKRKVMEIDPTDLDRPDLLSLYSTKSTTPLITFSIEPIADQRNHPDSTQQASKHLLELSLYQKCILDASKGVCFEKGKLFFVRPIEEGYLKRDSMEVGDGKFLVPGIRKTVQFIEGPSGRGNSNPAVVIDAIKVPFHKVQFVMEKISEILQRNPKNGIDASERERCIPVIKGLDCFSTYTGHTRHHRIKGIHELGSVQAFFQMKNGKQCSVIGYFEQKYKIKLKSPNANLLICNDRGNKNFYPMELMTISKNQRVRITQQTSVQSQKTVKECAVLPDNRQRLIMTGKRAADIDSSNPLLKRLGVSVCPEPLISTGRILAPGDIKFSDQTTSANFGKWRFSNYLRPADNLNKWIIYAVVTENTKSKVSDDVLKKFSSIFVIECNSKGIKMDPPAEAKSILATQIESHLERAADRGCGYVLMITEDTLTHLHQKYKLIERNRQMIVQDMKLSTANKIVLYGKKLTLDNIIQKTNIKLGGLNYVLSDKKLKNVLVIGIGFSIPQVSSEFCSNGDSISNPLVIGFASNFKAEYEFTGDFVLSSSSSDTIAPIEDIITQCLEQFKQYRDKTPKKILVYRSGSSDGAHASIISHEVPLARSAIERVSKEIKLIYIVVSKDHTHRFFKMSGADTLSECNMSEYGMQRSRSMRVKTEDLNIQSGVVVDSVVTNPASKQFFLNSHVTLQGTAKTPLYVVLADDCNARLSTLQEVTFRLCHAHQIVGQTTSLPTPLYVANEYAKRGRNLFTEKCKENVITIGASTEKNVLDTLTNEISYRCAGAMIRRRVNA